MPTKSSSSRTAGSAALAVALLAASGLATAGEHGRALRAPALPAYTQECGSCHVAYPPGLLPAASWQRLMGNLSHHFGTDASLDAPAQQSIATWLQANAGSYRRVREAPPADRITRSAWFTREHDEVPAAAWKAAAVKSPSNCSACHAQAEQGDFNEHNVRIPR